MNFNGLFLGYVFKKGEVFIVEIQFFLGVFLKFPKILYIFEPNCRDIACLNKNN